MRALVEAAESTRTPPRQRGSREAVRRAGEDEEASSLESEIVARWGPAIGRGPTGRPRFPPWARPGRAKSKVSRGVSRNGRGRWARGRRGGRKGRSQRGRPSIDVGDHRTDGEAVEGLGRFATQLRARARRAAMTTAATRGGLAGTWGVSRGADASGRRVGEVAFPTLVQARQRVEVAVSFDRVAPNVWGPFPWGVKKT